MAPHDNSCIKINDVAHLVHQLAKVVPNLKSLSLLYNPAVPNPLNEDNKDLYQQHRYYVISRLSHLENLDSTPVTAAEKKYVASKKLSEILPATPGGLGVLASLSKEAVAFQVSKEGELTLMGEEDEYVTWDPNYVKLGEGKLLIFNDSKHVRPEEIVVLSGYEVSVVEESRMLSKLAPHLELLQLTHEIKPKLLLVCKDKAALQEWLPLLVTESSDQSSQDWDAIERQSTKMKLLQESLTERSTQIRLKRALDQSYAIEANEIKLIKVLGHGGFGTVYLASVRGKSVAVKVFHNQQLSAEALDDFCNEVEILAKIHHPHVLNFIGACLEPLMIVTELMAGGDLQKLLLDDSATPLSLLTRLQMAKDAALGMAWLHGSDPMVLHRDVKTANFLVDENLRVVVADFGLSDKLRKGSSTWDDDGYKGTIYFTSPEVLKNAVFNEKSDVYSFGIVLWQILTRKELYPEFKRVQSNELEKAIFDTVVFKNVRPEIPAGSPDLVTNLIEDCWDVDPEKRPAFDKVVERLDEAIYKEAIPDATARDLWLEWFPGRQQVRWKAFWEHFVMACDPLEGGAPVSGNSSGANTPVTPVKSRPAQSSLTQRVLVGSLSSSSDSNANANNTTDANGNNQISPMFDDLPLKLLIHELLSPNMDMVLHQVNSDVVHIDQFGNFAQWFGPVGQRGHNPAKYAQSVVQNKWFFGQLSINQSFNLLNGQAPGTFLVRYSLSKRGDYSASFVTPSGAIAHQHITRKVIIHERDKENPVKIRYSVPSAGQEYETLFDLIDDQPYLRNRCTGWPFGWIFAGRVSVSNIEDSFLDTSQESEMAAIRSPRKV